MSGTKAGGKAAAEKNKAAYGKDYYQRIGAIGGRNGNTGGFAYWKSIGREDLISAAGRKGGRIGKPGSRKNA